MTGSINYVAALAALARGAGALVWVDAVQLAPHRLPDVQGRSAAISSPVSYKFFGPHLGILWGREALMRALPPHRVRGQGAVTAPPVLHRTPQTELLAGLDGDHRLSGLGRRGDGPRRNPPRADGRRLPAPSMPMRRG